MRLGHVTCDEAREVQGATYGQVAGKALASINWFVDKEVQNKTRELGGIDIVRRVKEAHPDNPAVLSTCDQILARIHDKPAVTVIDDAEDLYT